MARQVLPFVGAAIGFVASGFNPMGAQVGFAIGSVIGNAVDPIEMQGRKLGDSPSQVAAEGGARAIVFGKGCIRALCIIERGGRRVVKQRDRSGGKGGGPVTINERALWTYAIGLGEAIVGGAVTRIWEDERLVYDVTPTSVIQSDSAAYAQGFRFYDGSEDQLPDPAIEAIHADPTDAPYYRGTAYLVFPQRDLTDFGERIPNMRIEVVAAGAFSPGTIMAIGSVSTTGNRTSTSITGTTWESPKFSPFTFSQLLALSAPRFIAYSNSAAWLTDDYGENWTLADTSAFTGSPANNAAYRNRVLLIPANLDGVYRSLDDGLSFTRISASGFRINALQFVGAGNVVGLWASDFFFQKSGDSGLTWSVGGSHELSGGFGLSQTTHLGQAVFGGRNRFTEIPAVVSTADGDTHTEFQFSGSGGQYVSALASNNNPASPMLVAATDMGEMYYNDGTGWDTSTFTAPGVVRSIVWNGLVFVAGGGEGGAGWTATSANGIDWEFASQPLTYSVHTIAAQPPATSVVGEPIVLSSVISTLHDRCGHTADDYDVSELSDILAGVVIEQTITASEGVNSILGAYFADPADYDGKIRYIKRGKPVVRTLTADDLIDEPDTNQRKNAIEYPLKVHFFYQGSVEAYASPKATSSRYSQELQNVGEVSVASPVTFDSGQEPAEIAAKLHKVLWAGAEGEIEWHVTDEHLDLVPTDTLGLSHNGSVFRVRITQIMDDPGQRKLKMVRDRQSAYTSNITAIPDIPPPTPPQPSVPSETVLAIMDIPALTDSADTLNYYAAMSGASDTWAGAVLQQSLDDGNAIVNVDSTSLNAIMGYLQDDVSDASPYYTDTTNSVVVVLLTDDELESRSETSFLSGGGAFALKWQDGGVTKWEIMQFRDAELLSPKTYRLSHLMRGRKNSETGEHPAGSMFVLLDNAVLREAAQSTWIGTNLLHRAVSNGLSPETAQMQSNYYIGNSQREWPVAELDLSRPDADSVQAEVVPRHRFGSPMNPIRSVNWIGYRWTVTDGANTISRDGTADTETFDVTGWASPVSVTVAQLNRITGEGPTVTEGIA